ncbi:hypothetical protein B0H11DRAFT_1956646 [Mycena galericulata]|nr:hypothetical protein B0H11DRAFT_1956646 [Mycena galericulata]
MAPVLVKKTPCAVLLQLSAEDDAPTRFGGRKMRTLPGPSPLCAVCYASERMPVAATVPVPIVVPAAVPVTPVEPVSAPPIAVTLAHAIAAAYHSSDNEEDSASEYSDSDEDEDPSRFQVVPWIANSGVPVGAGSRSSLRAVNFPSYAPQHHSPGRSPRTRLLDSSSCNILQSHNVQHTSHTKPPAAKECLSPMTPKKTHHHRAVRIQKENSAARMKSPPRAFIV